jgi:hypothetical protein
MIHYYKFELNLKYKKGFSIIYFHRMQNCEQKDQIAQR